MKKVGIFGGSFNPFLISADQYKGAQMAVIESGTKLVASGFRYEDAPIFSVADYGIVGDLNKIVPALTEALVSEWLSTHSAT